MSVKTSHIKANTTTLTLALIFAYLLSAVPAHGAPSAFFSHRYGTPPSSGMRFDGNISKFNGAPMYTGKILIASSSYQAKFVYLDKKKTFAGFIQVTVPAIKASLITKILDDKYGPHLKKTNAMGDPVLEWIAPELTVSFYPHTYKNGNGEYLLNAVASY